MIIHFDFDDAHFKAIVKSAVIEAVAAIPSQNQQLQTEVKFLYSIQELADFLGCSTVTAQKYKNKGRIPCHQFGRKVMFDTVEVLRAIEQDKRKKK